MEKKYCYKIILSLCIFAMTFAFLPRGVIASELDENIPKYQNVSDIPVSELKKIYNDYIDSKEELSIDSYDNQYKNNLDEIHGFAHYVIDNKIVADTKVNQALLDKVALRMQFKVVVEVGKKKGYNTASICLDHSLQDNPSKLEFKNNDPIANQIKQSKEYKNVMANLKKTLKREKKKTYYQTGSMALESIKDLHLALHNVNYCITATKKGGSWHTTMAITDTYNFEWKTWKQTMGTNSKIVNILNNYAVLAQSVGAINEYSIEARVKKII